MSMRHYGVETKAMVLTDREFVELLWNNRETLDNSRLYAETLKDVDNFEDLGYWDYIDCASYIEYGTYFSEVDGQVSLYDEEQENICRYFRGDCIVIFELKKDTLFTKYENIEEIYRELLDRFKDVGIKIDIPYIKEHFGKVEFTYYG